MNKIVMIDGKSKALCGVHARFYAAQRLFVLALMFSLGMVSWAVEDLTIASDTVLSEDKTVGLLTVNAGVTLDLNGYNLTVTNLVGTGTITNSYADLTSPEEAVTAATLASTCDLRGTSVTNAFNNNFTRSLDSYNRVLAGGTGAAIITTSNPLAIDYDFGEGGEVVNTYRIYCGPINHLTRGPEDWAFYGSDDKELTTGQWTRLHSVADAPLWADSENGSECREYTFENTTRYRYYRMNFESACKTNNQQYLEFVQLEYLRKGGELRVNVAEGDSVTASDILLTGAVALVKEGPGTFTPSANVDQLYTGGTIVRDGTLVNSEKYSTRKVFGPVGATITVTTNATRKGLFNAHGNNAFGYKFILDGGSITNDVSLNSSNYRGFGTIALTADSCMDFTEPYNLMGRADVSGTDYGAEIDLQGNALYIRSKTNTFFCVSGFTTQSEGTITLSSGAMLIAGDGAHATLTNAVLTTEGDGQFIVKDKLTFDLGDYICNSTSTGLEDTSRDKNAPTVEGTFKPNTDYFHGVVLKDGSTLDLSGRTNPLNLRGLRYSGSDASATYLHTIAFADNATINVKIDRGRRGKIISWVNTPSNLDTISFVVRDETGRQYEVDRKENGLSIPGGLTLIFR